MICRECAARFEPGECSVVFGAMPYGEGCAYEWQGARCPQCGSTRLDEEGTCAVCEQECAAQEMEDGVCRLCAEETLQTLVWMWDMLSPAQKEWACEHTDWMEV